MLDKLQVAHAGQTVDGKAVVSDFVYSVLANIRKFYASYCVRNGIHRIEDVAKAGLTIDDLKADQRYLKALVCILFANTLIQTTLDEQERSAAIFWGLYLNLKKVGFTHDHALEEALGLFKVEFHADGSATLAMSDDDGSREVALPGIDDVALQDQDGA